MKKYAIITITIVIAIILVPIVLCILDVIIENHSAVTAIATVLLAVITFVYVLITNNLVKSAQDQIKLQKQIYEVENRPFISIKKVEFIKNESNTILDRYDLHIKVDNFGKQPAFITFCSYGDESSQFQKKKYVFPEREDSIVFKGAYDRDCSTEMYFTLEIKIHYQSIMTGTEYKTYSVIDFSRNAINVYKVS